MDVWRGWTVDRQSKQMVGACPAEWEISANCTKGNGTHGSVLSPYTGFRAGVSTMRSRCCGAVRVRSKWPVTFRTGTVRQARDVSAPSGFNYIVHIWNIKAVKNY